MTNSTLSLYELSHPYCRTGSWSETTPGISRIKQPVPVCYFRKGSALCFLPGLKQNCSLSAALLLEACQCFHSELLLPACYACEEIYVLPDSIWPKQAPLLTPLFFLKWFVNKNNQATTYSAVRIIPFQLPVKCKT